MRRDFSKGYDQPLAWLRDLLRTLGRQHLVSETNEFAFLTAYCGPLSIEPLPRVREGDETVGLVCRLRSVWNDNLFGLEQLNAVRSITIDGRQVAVRNVFGRGWNLQQYHGELELPDLVPGKHVVQCEVESAWVAAPDATGLASDAAPEDWPPAKRRWTRTCQAELAVYAGDATIVSVTEDPTWNPEANGTLSVGQAIIRHHGEGLTASVVLNVSSKAGQPVSVDVKLRLAGQEFECGDLWYDGKSTVGTRNSRQTGGNTAQDWVFSADIGRLDPQITEAEVLLVPDPQAVESHPSVDRIWGRDIVFSHVPLTRQDLAGDR